MAFEGLLRDIFAEGDLTIRLPGGRALKLGDGAPPNIVVAIADAATVGRILSQPVLGLGEAWMDGRIAFEAGSIQQLVELVCRPTSRRPARPRPGPVGRWLVQRFDEANARRRARRNIAHHYDLTPDLYRAFLDEDLQYSCAYFAAPGMSLEAAQEAKKRHIAAKLDLRPGQRVLDIGCGFGGMALSIAAWTGASVDGITLSTRQLELARARAEAAGLAHLARFSLTDFRDAAGPYDRIVSVGMFEHVGRPNYGAFFDQIARLLTDDGVALIHAIGRMEGPTRTDAFTARYIFPGGYIPALSEVVPHVERAGLWITDLEILRLHYAETLKAWGERFARARAAMAELYDERFCRMWEYYLVCAEMSFRYGRHMNFQIQLARRRDALPITRDYMAKAEAQLAQAERRVA